MLNNTIFEFGSYTISLGQLVLALIMVVLWAFSFFRARQYVYQFFNIDRYEDKSKFYTLLGWAIHILFIILVAKSLGLDYVLFESEHIRFSVINIMLAILIIQVARALDWMGQHFINSSTAKIHGSGIKVTSGSRIVQTILILFAILLLIENFDLDKGFSTSLGSDESMIIHLSNIIMATLVILAAKLFHWIVTRIFLQGFYNSQSVEQGIQFAFNQLLAYIIYTIAIIIALQNLGLNMNLIWGGAAALLVGIGLGLQQTFADFFAGVVLLFERSVKMGDVLEMNDTKGVVQKIGLRTSVIVTPREQSLVIPNSNLMNQTVTNWTHLNNKLRFEVRVGVAYGSDTKLVKSLLLQSVEKNPYILKSPAPFVRFMDFGNSSLDFGIFFFSTNHMSIDDILSDVRFEIDHLFRENGVTIPFPQRDVWIKSNEE